MMRPDYRIRIATTEDADVLAHHRAAMFLDIGWVNRREASLVEEATRPKLSEMIASGEYIGWLVEYDGAVIAGGGAMIRRLLPRPGSLEGGEEAYILNVYTEPQYRRRGLARKLMETILDWTRERGVTRVTLHPSEDGKSLYESLGFVQTQEMRWKG